MAQPDPETTREPHEWLLVTLARGIAIALVLTFVWMAIIHEVGKVLG